MLSRSSILRVFDDDISVPMVTYVSRSVAHNQSFSISVMRSESPIFGITLTVSVPTLPEGVFCASKSLFLVLSLLPIAYYIFFSISSSIQPAKDARRPSPSTALSTGISYLSSTRPTAKPAAPAPVSR
jgi:hypothetical protein